MSILSVIFFIAIMLCELLCIYFVTKVKKSAENSANILQNRKIEYESEKGKNLATKEDIEEITKKVEEVKSVVSLSAQKRYEHLNEQERILVDILNVATLIAQSQNKLLLYLYDTSSRERHDLLIETINDNLSRFYYLCNLAVITVEVEDVEKIIKELSARVAFLAAQVCVTATNAANLISQYNAQLDYALNKVNVESGQGTFLAVALETKQQIEEMRDKPIAGKEELGKAIDNYKVWLKRLYGTDFFVYPCS